MSVVLLAAGYGTRLYPLTIDRPKALLPLGSRGVILDGILKAVEAVPSRSKVVLVTNAKFFPQFEAWHQGRQHAVELVNDGTSTPETRLGAIRDLLLATQRMDSGDDLLVLGTDNLFTWPLADFVAFAQTKRPAATVALRQAPSLQEASRCAVVELDGQARLVGCVEKPSAPASQTVALCVYYFPPACRRRVEEFVRAGGNVDAPGFFVEWLVRQEPVYGCMTQGAWFDIGTLASYQQAVQAWEDRAS